MRAGTSPFLNAPSFDLSPGRCFAPPHQPLGSFCPVTHCRCPPPSSHRPLCPCTAQSHLYTLDMVLQYHTWWYLTFPASPRSTPPRAAPALCRQNPQAVWPRCGQPLSSSGTSSHRTGSYHQPPPSALCTEIFHHSPLTKVPFLHERCSGTLFHQQTSGGFTKVLSKGVGHPSQTLSSSNTFPATHPTTSAQKKHKGNACPGASSTVGGGAMPAGARPEQVDEGASSSHEFTAALYLAGSDFYSTIFNILGF